MPHWIGIEDCVRASFVQDRIGINSNPTYRVHKKSSLVSTRLLSILTCIAERTIRSSTFVHCCGLTSVAFARLEDSSKSYIDESLDTVSARDTDTSEEKDDKTDMEVHDTEEDTFQSESQNKIGRATTKEAEKTERIAKKNILDKNNAKEHTVESKVEEIATYIDVFTATISALGGHAEPHCFAVCERAAILPACYRQTVCNCVRMDLLYDEYLLCSTPLSVANQPTQSVCHQQYPASVTNICIVAVVVALSVSQSSAKPIFPISPRQLRRALLVLFAVAPVELNWSDSDTRSAPPAPCDLLDSVATQRRMRSSRRLRRKPIDFLASPCSEVSISIDSYTIVSACRIEVDCQISTVACFSCPYVCYPVFVEDNGDAHFRDSALATDPVESVFLGSVRNNSGERCLRLLEETRLCVEEEVIGYM